MGMVICCWIRIRMMRAIILMGKSKSEEIMSLLMPSNNLKKEISEKIFE